MIGPRCSFTIGQREAARDVAVRLQPRRRREIAGHRHAARNDFVHRRSDAHEAILLLRLLRVGIVVEDRIDVTAFEGGGHSQIRRHRDGFHRAWIDAVTLQPKLDDQHRKRGAGDADLFAFEIGRASDPASRIDQQRLAGSFAVFDD